MACDKAAQQKEQMYIDENVNFAVPSHWNLYSFSWFSRINWAYMNFHVYKWYKRRANEGIAFFETFGACYSHLAVEWNYKLLANPTVLECGFLHRRASVQLPMRSSLPSAPFRLPL